MADGSALSIATTYHDAWTGGDFDDAAALLSSDLVVEVPVNEYPTAESFADAVRGFGSLARNVELLSAVGGADEAMLLYDMDVDGLGQLRVVEHFTVAAGKIVRVRQIHDTAQLRAAGFVAAAA